MREVGDEDAKTHSPITLHPTALSGVHFFPHTLANHKPHLIIIERKFTDQGPLKPNPTKTATPANR